jgi:hypothetical protein
MLYDEIRGILEQFLDPPIFHHLAGVVHYINLSMIHEQTLKKIIIYITNDTLKCGTIIIVKE